MLGYRPSLFQGMASMESLFNSEVPKPSASVQTASLSNKKDPKRPKGPLLLSNSPHGSRQVVI